MTQLEEAKAAYHDLMTGRMARVVVDQNGERIEYTAANAARLDAYIKRLESEVAGDATPVGPMRIFL